MKKNNNNPPSPFGLPQSNPAPTRRTFIKTTLTAAAVFSLPRFSIGKPGPQPGSKLNVACIGIGNRGWFAVSEILSNPNVNLVAVCDVDEKLVEKTYRKAADYQKETDSTLPALGTIPLFKDYREMFASIGDKIDAVTISTPDHHHYPAGMLAIKNGKHVYIEKPLTNTIGEARALREAARKHGVVTQMGNQGRASDGIRLIREWTQAGVLGEVREVRAWSPPFPERYFKRPKALPLAAEKPPATLAWDLWLGPADERPYNSLYTPETWRGWWGFGSGMLGDWGCHTLDGPFWALDLGAPDTVEAEVSDATGIISPEWAVVTYKFPARGNLPPVTMKWFEGSAKKPAAPANWDPATPFPERGMLMVGDKNTLYSPSGRPNSPRLVPNAVMEEFKKNRPPATLPRVARGPVAEWVNAICGHGPKPGSNFEYAVPLTEVVLLGALAVRTGKKIEWDAKAGRIRNDAALDRLAQIHAREGWRV
jgi:predicted dehydrogenase